MTSHLVIRRGFTLIELLISVSIIVAITTAAVTATSQMLVLTRRLQAFQTMDASAKTLIEKLSGEVAAMHPCAAVWLSSDPTNGVEFVFMYCKPTPRGSYESKLPVGVGRNMGFTDTVWSRWHWSGATGIVSVATGRSGRWVAIANDQGRDYWKIPSGSRMGASISSFLTIPRLVRETGTSTSPMNPKDILNANAWQSGEPTDVGDYDDLVLNMRPLLENCTNLTIDIRCSDGLVKTANGVTPLSWAAPGSYVDGRDQMNLSDRPSLVRIRFTLTDPATGANRIYSFSCATPSIPAY